MIKGYNVTAQQDKWGNLICKECPDKYCVTVRDESHIFCPSYRGSAFDGKSHTFSVKCKESK